MVHLTIPTEGSRCSSYMGWEDTMRFLHNLKHPILNIRGYDICNLQEVKLELDVSHFWDIKRAKKHILTEMFGLLGVVDVFTVEY